MNIRENDPTNPVYTHTKKHENVPTKVCNKILTSTRTSGDSFFTVSKRSSRGL